MTAPIQEPNLYRQIGGLSWGQNQLFRRPPPRGAEISVFRAYRALDPISVSGNGTTADVTWDIWENCDTDVFESQTVGDEMTALDLLVPGSVVICWGIKMNVSPNDTWAQYLIDDEPVFGANTYTTLHGRATNGAQSLEAMPSLIIQTFSRSYPTMDPFSSGNQFPVRFTWAAGQITNTTRDIEFGFLDVRYEPANICEGPIES